MEVIKKIIVGGSIVAWKKANGKIRLFLDYSTWLNKVFGSYQYPYPVPEDVFANLNGGTCFTKTDFAGTNLYIEVDPIYQPLRSGRIWHKVNF